MAKRVTIPRDANIDPFYRYKREYTKVVHLSKGGGRTVVENIESISHDIQKPVSFIKRYLQKFMGTSIGAGFSFPGRIPSNVIDDAIERLIAEHVLCPDCGNPETGDGNCDACGCVSFE
jgi:translation initiation factor 2 beta subunit (eIF-2beta)/eIF-5